MLIQSGLETSARGCRSTSLLLSYALSLSLSRSLDLPLSIFPSFSFSVWKVSVKGPRWKAALNGSVIAVTALAAQGATRIAHSELLHPTKMHTAIVHSLCLCDIRKMLSLTVSFLHRFIYQQHVDSSFTQEITQIWAPYHMGRVWCAMTQTLEHNEIHTNHRQLKVNTPTAWCFLWQ